MNEWIMLEMWVREILVELGPYIYRKISDKGRE